MENAEKTMKENGQFNEEQIKKTIVKDFLDEYKKLNKFQKITVRNFFYSNKNEYLEISIDKGKNMVVSIKNEILKKQKTNFCFEFNIKISCEEIYDLLKNN